MVFVITLDGVDKRKALVWRKRATQTDKKIGAGKSCGWIEDDCEDGYVRKEYDDICA